LTFTVPGLYNLIAIVLISVEVFTYENDLPAQEKTEVQRTWFPETHAHIIRPGYTQKAETERQEAADRLKTAGPVVFFFRGLAESVSGKGNNLA